MIRTIFLFLLTSIVALGCSKFSKVQKSTDFAYKLRSANEYFAKADWDKARELYEECYGVYKGTKEFEDLYFNLSYCYYNEKDYLSAENFFKGYVETFPNSPRAEECDFMRCFCYFKQSPKVELDQSATQKAIGNFQTFINTHPGSPRIKEATDIIDKCRGKLEAKAFQAAELYFNLGQYKSAATSFSNILDDFGDSPRADEYKLMVVKSNYLYALNSIEEKQPERYEKVLNDCNDFTDRFPDSKLKDEVDKIKKQVNDNLKILNNEQNKKAA